MNGTCWIVYDSSDLEDNRFFADELVKHGDNLGMDTRIVTLDALPDDIPDLIINRSRDHVFAERYDSKGSIVINNPETTRIANDKALTYELARELGIPFLPYVLPKNGSFDTSGLRLPFVIKSRTGHGGTEVSLSYDADMALDDARRTHMPLIQEASRDLGVDMRIYMLDGRVLAAVMRSNDEDFRANFKLGGKAEICQPLEETVDYAERICRKLEAGFMGVDFVFSDGRPYLNEVEDAVGTRMLYSLTDLDPALLLMELAHSKMSL